MAFADDVERLQQRHAGLHHGRELPREQGDVLGPDRTAAAEFLRRNLGDHDALTPQHDVDHRLAAGADFTTHQLAVLVLAFPDEGCFFDALLSRSLGGKRFFRCGHNLSSWRPTSYSSAISAPDGGLCEGSAGRPQGGSCRLQGAAAAGPALLVAGGVRSRRTTFTIRSWVCTISMRQPPITMHTPDSGMSCRYSTTRPDSVLGPSSGSARPSFRLSSRKCRPPSTRIEPSAPQLRRLAPVGTLVVNSPIISSTMSS